MLDLVFFAHHLAPFLSSQSGGGGGEGETQQSFLAHLLEQLVRHLSAFLPLSEHSAGSEGQQAFCEQLLLHLVLHFWAFLLESVHVLGDGGGETAGPHTNAYSV